jgi:hypothetical protein
VSEMAPELPTVYRVEWHTGHNLVSAHAQDFMTQDDAEEHIEGLKNQAMCGPRIVWYRATGDSPMPCPCSEHTPAQEAS